MVDYYFLDNRGRSLKIELPNLNRALYIAASHHEKGYYIDFMKEGSKYYSRDQVLLLCRKYNLL